VAQVTHSDSGDAKLQDQLPSNPAGAVERARKRVSDGDLAGAVKELALYVAAHPKEIEPARYLGDLYYRQSDLPAAERTYLAILRFAPGDKETHNRLGGIYAVQDRVTEAIEQFQKSLPRSDSLGRLVVLHQRLGDLAAFTNEYRIRALDHPSEFGDQYNYGLILRNERRPLDEQRQQFELFQALNGLASASGLFFVAAGLSLIFGVTRIINIAHGSLYMLGTYIAVTLATAIGGAVGFWGGVVASAIIVIGSPKP